MTLHEAMEAFRENPNDETAAQLKSVQLTASSEEIYKAFEHRIDHLIELKDAEMAELRTRSVKFLGETNAKHFNMNDPLYRAKLGYKEGLNHAKLLLLGVMGL